jgi:flagellar biosynthesis protein
MSEDTVDIRKKAVALRYDAQQDMAPRVVAKGSGILAERIIEVAKEHGIQLHEDPDLVAVLSKLDLDAMIPENLYRAVAEVLAFVYRMNKKRL